jgi:hypothetical protein
MLARRLPGRCVSDRLLLMKLEGDDDGCWPTAAEPPKPLMGLSLVRPCIAFHLSCACCPVGGSAARAASDAWEVPTSAATTAQPRRMPFEIVLDYDQHDLQESPRWASQLRFLAQICGQGFSNILVCLHYATHARDGAECVRARVAQ